MRQHATTKDGQHRSLAQKRNAFLGFRAAFITAVPRATLVAEDFANRIASAIGEQCRRERFNITLTQVATRRRKARSASHE
jgi:hypothetical protein